MEIRLKETGAVIPLYDVKKIVIYGGGLVKFFYNSGYLEFFEKDRSGLYSQSYACKLEVLYLNSEPKRAIKENLNRTDNFYMKFIGEYSFESGKVLYIHESEISVVDNGEKLAFKDKNQACYFHAFMLVSDNAFEIRQYHREIVEGTDGDFTPPTGKWSSCAGTAEAPNYELVTSTLFHKHAPYVVKHWFTYEKISNLPTAQPYYSRTDESDSRKEARRIAEIVNNNRAFYNEVSYFEIEHLLELFDLTEKQPQAR